MPSQKTNTTAATGLRPTLKSSVSLLSLAIASTFAAQSHAQMSTTTTADGEMISIAAGTTNSTMGTPTIVLADNDVTLTNSGTLTSTGVTQTVQVTGSSTGAAINNTATGVINADSRAINVNGQNTTIDNSGSILGTRSLRNAAEVYP